VPEGASRFIAQGRAKVGGQSQAARDDIAGDVAEP
jgi:hypothetical protein